MGRAPAHNEDAYLCDEALSLFIVADGLGGHEAGDVASALCVHKVRDIIAENRDMLDQLAAGDPDVDRSAVLRVLEHAIQTAASQIRERAAAAPQLERMGTTCSLLLLVGERGFIAHVGDSRVYLVRHHTVHQLSEDHCLANELQRRGRIKMEDLADSGYKELASAVTRAVGIYENVEVDTFDLKVLPGDHFLLCTDGQHGYLDDVTISRAMDLTRLSAAVERLISCAYQGGGHDNITSIAVRIVSEESSPLAATLSDRLAANPLLLHLDHAEIERLAAAVEELSLADGDRICEGHPGDALFIVSSGAIDLEQDGERIARFDQGDLVSGVFLEERADDGGAVALAAGPTRLLVIRWSQLVDAISEDPRLAIKLQWSLAHLLARPQQRISRARPLAE